MSGLDFGHASSNLHGEQNLIDSRSEGVQPRFFQKQTAGPLQPVQQMICEIVYSYQLSKAEAMVPLFKIQ